MKIIIGEKVFDSEKEAILIVLNKNDKQNIVNMTEDSYGYLCYPSTMNTDEAQIWGKKQMSNIFTEYKLIGKKEK